MRITSPSLALATALVAFAVAGSARAQQAGDCKVIENFAQAKVGELPTDWRVREEEGKDVYSVREEGGLHFLHAHARGLGVQAAKQYEWDLNAYPVLAWSWRPIEFPQGADEKEGKNDSAVAVYLLGPYSRVLGFKSVKYIWSEKVVPGTRLSSSRGRTQVLVLRSGAARKGEWVEERVNVRNDYLKFFDEKEVPKPAGVAVLTDSDDTRSSAQGDYANFRICRG
ncbi:MAG: DUF3047 domain-containing protein [Candidatus Rokuibacteriota bacterium]